jgi:hypothetical protein
VTEQDSGAVRQPHAASINEQQVNAQQCEGQHGALLQRVAARKLSHGLPPRGAAPT